MKLLLSALFLDVLEEDDLLERVEDLMEDLLEEDLIEDRVDDLVEDPLWNEPKLPASMTSM